MVKQVTIHEAKTHLSRLLRRVEAGEEVVIARGSTAIAKLVPIPPPVARRAAGRDKGHIRLSDDFDAPLPDSVLDALYGTPMIPE